MNLPERNILPTVHVKSVSLGILPLKIEFVETTKSIAGIDSVSKVLNRSASRVFFHLLGLKKMAPVDAI